MSTPPTVPHVHDSDRKAAEAPRMPFPYHTKAEDPHLRVTETFFRETTDLGTPRGGWQTEVYNPLHQVIFVAYGLTKKSSMERAAKLCELFHTQDIIARHHAEERAAMEKSEAALSDMIACGQFCVDIMHHCADPKNEKPFAWKDVALQMYAAFHKLPEARAALTALRTASQ